MTNKKPIELSKLGNQIRIYGAVEALQEAADTEDRLATIIEKNIIKLRHYYKKNSVAKSAALQSAREKRMFSQRVHQQIRKLLGKD